MGQPPKPTETFRARVISPARIHYDGYAVSVTATNKTGCFDVLARHANFFSILQSGDVIIDTGAKIVRFNTTHGIVKVTNNIVTVFINLPAPTRT